MRRPPHPRRHPPITMADGMINSNFDNSLPVSWFSCLRRRRRIKSSFCVALVHLHRRRLTLYPPRDHHITSHAGMMPPPGMMVPPPPPPPSGMQLPPVSCLFVFFPFPPVVVWSSFAHERFSTITLTRAFVHSFNIRSNEKTPHRGEKIYMIMLTKKKTKIRHRACSLRRGWPRRRAMIITR